MIIQKPIITSSISGDNIKTNVSGAYIGYEATASVGSVQNELVFGLGTTGSGTNTVTIGNTDTVQTKLFGSIYQHYHLTGSNTITHNISKFNVYTMSGSFTASLPSSPNQGDSIKMVNISTRITGSDRYRSPITASEQIHIDRNGSNIMGFDQNMNLDYVSPSFELIYANSSSGWVIVGGG